MGGGRREAGGSEIEPGSKFGQMFRFGVFRLGLLSRSPLLDNLDHVLL